MGRQPKITTETKVELYREMVDLRRLYCDDDQFFKAADLWEYLADDDAKWRIKTYKTSETEDFKRKAGVIQFAEFVTLTTDEKLWLNAKRGRKLENFVLAHELAHLALDHHARGAVTKNFQLFAGPCGMSNIPPTVEELEANYAAVFLQCGKAIMDNSRTPRELADRAFTDAHLVEKLMKEVQKRAFQELLGLPVRKRPRVVL